jgi:hypothetical protein
MRSPRPAARIIARTDASLADDSLADDSLADDSLADDNLAEASPS